MPSVTIVRANPLDHAAGIKALFVAHERPEFPEFFDRAYPAAVAAGGSSWIGTTDGAGEPVLHVALFRQRFMLDGRLLVGGLVVNLMAAREHRTFLPARALMRRMIADAKTDGGIDFLYGDPNQPAWALLKSVGFTPVGTLRRFALLIANHRWYVDIVLRLYALFKRLRARGPQLVAVTHTADRYDAAPFERPAASGAALRPFRPAALYRQRLPGYPAAGDHWIALHRSRAAAPVAAVLVRRGEDGIARVASLIREPGLPMSAILPPLAGALRREGASRIWISTLEESQFGGELARAGFVPRPDGTPVVALPLTDAGAAAVAAASRWEITDLDCDR